MNEKMSFEQALSRLEEIVAKLEQGNIALEESLSIYQEGMQLSKTCSQMLQEVEGKVMAVMNKGEGTVSDFSINTAKEA